MPSPFTPDRRPLDVDVHDDAEVRGWLARVVSEQVLTRREPVPGIHLLFDGWEEVLEWHRVLEADPGADLGATWTALATRRGPERRVFVFGIVHEGGGREAAMIEEMWEDGEALGWWYAHRPYTVVDGVGKLLDTAWQQHGGTGRVPEPFRSLLTAKPGGRPPELLPARAPDPEVWVQEGVVPSGRPLPSTAMEMAEHAQAAVLEMLEREGFRHLLVVLLVGRDWQKWLLGDPLPASGDDLVRWICARAGKPDAVATAEGVLVEFEGRSERAVRIVAEANGARAERAILMRPKPGKPEDVVPDRVLARELGPVAEGDGWIGVEPVLAGELTATPLGRGPSGEN